MMRNCIVFFCLLIFISCGNKNKIPEGVLKPDIMQAILWDVIKADAFTAEIIRKDSVKKKRRCKFETATGNFHYSQNNPGEFL